MSYTIGPNSLSQVAPSVPGAAARAKELGEAMHRFSITEPHACAHFIAQCAHESGEFRYIRELWGPTPDQKGYWKRRDIQGPGPLYPGLGYLTRGAGYIQTTGRVNFKKTAAKLGVSYPRLLVVANTRKYAALMAAVWWSQNMPHDMSSWTVEQVTHRVNGGYNGLGARRLYTQRAMARKQFLTPRKA